MGIWKFESFQVDRAVDFNLYLIVFAFRVQVFGTFKTRPRAVVIAERLEQMIASLRRDNLIKCEERHDVRR
jgi:hypothetical protein